MNIIAPSDAPVVRNLKKAGAIVPRPDQAPRFSFRGFTDNPLHGLTLNPWDSDITCGGSSGGAGAAVAAGIGTIAHGNDIGGSLRWPRTGTGSSRSSRRRAASRPINESAAAERPMLAHLNVGARPAGAQRRRRQGGARSDEPARSGDPWWVAAPLVGPRNRKGRSRSRSPSCLTTWTSPPRGVRRSGRPQTIFERSGYRVSETEVPDLNGVWQTWCDIITNETAKQQEAAMLKVTSPDFHAAWGGIKAKANTLDLPGWMRATAARNTHIRVWQLFLEDSPDRTGANDGEADARPARGCYQPGAYA